MADEEFVREVRRTGAGIMQSQAVMAMYSLLDKYEDDLDARKVLWNAIAAIQALDWNV